jgi:hypothetical protein
MNRDLVSIGIGLSISIYLLRRDDLYLFTRIVLLYGILWFVGRLQNIYDYENALPLVKDKIQPGTIMIYAIRDKKLSFHPLDLYRLLGDRYLHSALVLSHQGELKVLDWRPLPVKEFAVYRLRSAFVGHVYLVPVEEYMDHYGKNIIIRTYTPPETVSVEYNPKIIQQIASESRVVVCSSLCMRYLALAGVVPDGSVKMEDFLKNIPLAAKMKLLRRNWREDYFVTS